MPTPAEGGNPAATPARRMAPLYPGATTTATLPPLPVDSREQLVYLLTQAAELEQGILCEYLFALYSLKRDPGDGLDPEQRALVTRRGDTLAATSSDQPSSSLVAWASGGPMNTSASP